MHQWRAGPSCRQLQGREAWMHLKDRSIVLGQGHPLLQGQTGHAVDAAIARRHQRHREALASQLQGFAAALTLQGELAVAAELIRPAQRL